jgi:hypothetical protein
MTTSTTAVQAMAMRVPTIRDARRMASVSLSTMAEARLVMAGPGDSPVRGR